MTMLPQQQTHMHNKYDKFLVLLTRLVRYLIASVPNPHDFVRSQALAMAFVW